MDCLGEPDTEVGCQDLDCHAWLRCEMPTRGDRRGDNGVHAVDPDVDRANELQLLACVDPNLSAEVAGLRDTARSHRQQPRSPPGRWPDCEPPEPFCTANHKRTYLQKSLRLIHS